MNRPTSPLQQWREIVHPIFWPVFFWNLARFAKFLRLRIASGGNGLISFDVTWWGSIRIFEVFDPDAPAWDAKLEGCAQRIHIATLDVFNPHLSTGVILSHRIGAGLRARAAALSAGTALASTTAVLIYSLSTAEGKRARVELTFGAFPNLTHLNTS